MQRPTKVKNTLKLFWQQTKPYKLVFFSTVFGLILAVVLGVIIPLFYGRFFDLIAKTVNQDINKIYDDLFSLLFLILALNLMQWIFWRVTNWGTLYFQPRIMADLSNTCFKHLHKHSYRFFTNNFTGSLVKKVNRLVKAFEHISDIFLYEFGTVAVEVIAILIVLITINIYLALLLFVWIIIFIGFNLFFSRYKLKYDLKQYQADTKVTAHLADTISNSIAIKLFAGFNYEARLFAKLNEERRFLTCFSWKLSWIMEAFQALLMIALEFFIFYLSLRFWKLGIFGIGIFAVIQVYIMRLFRKLWSFGRLFRRVYEELASAQEMVDILETEPEIKDQKNAKKLVVKRGEIEFKEVQFGYCKDSNVFPAMNLKIKPQERVAIIGPSGGGKSTFVKLLFRFFDTKSGTIYIDGQNIRLVTQESLRRSISLVPQEVVLFHRSLRENIRYGSRNASERQIEVAAKLANCDNFINKLPHGYDTLVGERGVKISGGERQRVAIARAILKNTPILVLDEATSNLDSQSELMIQDALENLMQGKTVVIIAHRLSTIMQMDRIVVIEDGCIVEQGTHAELLDKEEGLYQRLWKLQAGGFVK